MTENDRLDFWTELLHLDGFRVAHIRTDTASDPVVLTLIPSPPLGICPRCHRVCHAIHGRRDSQPIKDLSVCGQAVELIFRSYQFQGPHCRRYFSSTPPTCATVLTPPIASWNTLRP